MLVEVDTQRATRLRRGGWLAAQSVLRRPLVVRGRAAWRRYYAIGMNRTASAVTYFAVLTLFPFISLLYLGAGQLVASDPRFLGRSRSALRDSLGLSDSVVVKLYSAEATASIRATMVIIGLVGLVYAGWAWMDSFRYGVRCAWAPDAAVGWLRRYLRDWVTLMVTLPSVLIMVVLSVFISGGPYHVLVDLGVPVELGWRRPLQVLAFLITLVWSSGMTYLAYRRVGGAGPSRALWSAALACGVCLTVLCVAGVTILRDEINDPYGIVVALLALMLWVSAAVRVVLAGAIWATTPAAPSGDPPHDRAGGGACGAGVDPPAASGAGRG